VAQWAAEKGKEKRGSADRKKEGERKRGRRAQIDSDFAFSIACSYSNSPMGKRRRA